MLEQITGLSISKTEDDAKIPPAKQVLFCSVPYLMTKNTSFFKYDLQTSVLIPKNI